MPTRRRVLATVGVAVATAGCSQTGNSGSDGLNTASSEATQLGEIQLQNDHDSDHELQLAVEVDDSVVHLDTYTLTEGNSIQVAAEWMDSAGDYQVHARLDEGGIQTIEIAEQSTECTRILIRIGTDGALSIWNGSCSTAATDDPPN